MMVCGVVVGSPLEIIISYNVQEYELRTLSKSGDFQKDLRIINNSGDDTLDTPSFQTRIHDNPSFLTRLTPMVYVKGNVLS